jgi:hypothetical protein
MIYYKLLDIENIDIIIEKCLLHAKTIDSAYNRILGSWNDINALELINACPELAVGLQKYNFSIRMAALFVMYHPSHNKIHIDSYPSNARINIPLLNCTNTYTNFYESDDGMTLWTNPISGITSYKPKGKCRLVDRVELKQATIIRTSVFHTVDFPNSNPVPRITLTLGLDKDPVFMLE